MILQANPMNIFDTLFKSSPVEIEPEMALIPLQSIAEEWESSATYLAESSDEIENETLGIGAVMLQDIEQFAFIFDESFCQRASELY